MIPRTYLILSPAAPGETSRAIAYQRQTIPMVWAFAVASPTTKLHVEGPDYYFETTIGDALAMLDRGLAAWNYNRYFRDLLAPFRVFRSWLATNPSETRLYLNLTEVINASPSAPRDLLELANLSEKVSYAMEEIEGKHFTPFLHLLRKLSYPLVTIPITGDRETDIAILTQEMRDMPTPEAEMALQMVGFDTSRHMLHDAIASIRLVGPGEEMDVGDEETGAPCSILYTTNMSDAAAILVDELGASLLSQGPGRMVLTSGDREFLVVSIAHSNEIA